MLDEESKLERKGAAPTRRRRARATDADAEVNPPGEPSQRRAALGWERRSKQMRGRKGTMKTHPWAPKEEEPTTESNADGDDDDDFDDEDEDSPRPGGPPGRSGTRRPEPR